MLRVGTSLSASAFSLDTRR